ncbi:haloacid dehalogenase-like hydrolase domain-containing protein At4g39970 isoform X2 [Brachypodium distachyon]|uniref:haloacid dehalogenase-like hydrolase domain-containing protein At4g39970 isoform X2 n=1 Tax=Brachypodium distachyon TaxID=15368 RepID=UPI0001D43985|nr:haloacid dehalogenase-like hydrolase domain-containing protein At4g39970 isoform X2 [Brachypodium distachyon]|eukprot:XP_024316593.1 haloacid dehalogenase-like hydrolase domain-containing protein At4g39970 isoform X2 [Brachypodium distachyon]
MASTSLLIHTSFYTAAAARRSPSGLPFLRPRRASRLVVSASASSPPPSLDALIFDCDGVILESEHFHMQAYNDAFAHFGVRCPPDAAAPLHWDEDFNNDLQSRITGGKPKMRWYFGEHGWPSSKIFETQPSSDSDKEQLIDIIQDWKTERFKEIIKSGTVEPRPGVLRLMDEAKDAGIKLSVCSAAAKSSVVMCLENLIGLERFNGLDCFLAGDDVKLKKPDPSIYILAAKKLGVESKNCLVVEDSIIGLQDFKHFKDAVATYPDLSNVRFEDLRLLLQESLVTG